jgi:hypothetical protein
MSTWKKIAPDDAFSGPTGMEHDEASTDGSAYALSYLSLNDETLVNWLEKQVTEGQVVVCPYCHFAHNAAQDCDICRDLSDRARVVFEQHEPNDVFGPYLKGGEDVGKELTKLRTERVESLYNLSEGAYEAAVTLSIEAALTGLRGFWDAASRRRPKASVTDPLFFAGANASVLDKLPPLTMSNGAGGAPDLVTSDLLSDGAGASDLG